MDKHSSDIGILCDLIFYICQKNVILTGTIIEEIDQPCLPF